MVLNVVSRPAEQLAFQVLLETNFPGLRPQRLRNPWGNPTIQGLTSPPSCTNLKLEGHGSRPICHTSFSAAFSLTPTLPVYFALRPAVDSRSLPDFPGSHCPASERASLSYACLLSHPALAFSLGNVIFLTTF